MIRTIFAAVAAALICAAVPAEARSRHPAAACVETGTVMRPSCMGNDFMAGIRSISVLMKRERRAREPRPTAKAERRRVSNLSSSVDRMARPARYISGRLICALNVNSALAERGIRGTGSALAKSFLGWGRASGPVPGAVAVSSRRGGGHVALVSRVERGTVYVWNPSPRGRGWQEVAYRHRAVSFRVPG